MNYEILSNLGLKYEIQICFIELSTNLLILKCEEENEIYLSHCFYEPQNKNHQCNNIKNFTC